MRFAFALAACAGAAVLLVIPSPERTDLPASRRAIQTALQAGTGVVRLPAGVIEIESPLVIPGGSHDLEITGASSGSILRATDRFQGRAMIQCGGAARIRLSNFTIDGNRAALETRTGLPPHDVPFSGFATNNGVLAEDTASLRIRDVRFVNVAGFPILVSRSSDVWIERARVQDSGSRNAKGRNNTTGGILLEEGTAGFQVLNCELKNIRGNGIWTHSLYTSPRSRDGRIAGNTFETIGRDAIQIGHAIQVLVEENRGSHIGYPVDEVDMEARAIPVAIDTAGNTEQCVYARNRFEEINGKCIDLDGFHDGEVRANTCFNRGAPEDYPYGNYGIVMNNSNPDMHSERILITENEIDGALFGGIFIIGTGHTVTRNRLRNLNTAHCNENAAKFGCYYAAGEPQMLSSGIYLGRGAERPDIARNNVIRENEISGYQMGVRCIAAAPGVSLSENRIERNRCTSVKAPEN